jgi:hypothetical protein
LKLLDVNVVLAAHRDDHPDFGVARAWLIALWCIARRSRSSISSPGVSAHRDKRAYLRRPDAGWRRVPLRRPLIGHS